MNSVETITRLHHAGYSPEDIARATNLSLDWIGRILRRNGLVKINHRNVVMDGANLGDPKRADKLLRKFSWQAEDGEG